MRLPVRLLSLTAVLIVLIVLGRSYMDELTGASAPKPTARRARKTSTKTLPKAVPSPTPKPVKAKEAKKFTQQIANVGDVPLEYQSSMDVVKNTLTALALNRPEVAQLDRFDRNIRSDEEILSNGELPPTSGVLAWYLQITESEKKALRSSHASAVSALPTSLPDGTFSRMGVVIHGSGMEFPSAVAAVKWIRGLNREIPIEVMVDSSNDYEVSYCDTAFPTMNVKCVVLEETFGPELYGLISSNGDSARKYLSAIASTFEDVYFMNPESLPLEDPEQSFHTIPYKEHGLVLFRGAKDSYISPHFYSVADVHLGGRARGRPVGPVDIIRQSDRVNAVPGYSTDGTTFIINKRRHMRSLLLALFYNLNGRVYYPLLMQGAEGDEDRETLAAAVTALGEHFYKTDRKPSPLGYYEDQHLNKFGKLLPDPETDYQRYVEYDLSVDQRFAVLKTRKLKANSKYLLRTTEESDLADVPRLQKCRYFGKIQYKLGDMDLDTDIEEVYFKVLTEMACDWANGRGWIPNDWEGEDVSSMCKHMHEHLKWLVDNLDAGAPQDQNQFDIDDPIDE